MNNKIINIYKFGSCRSSICNHLNKSIHFTIHPYMTHTTKEVLQAISLLISDKNILDTNHKDCITLDTEKFIKNKKFYLQKLLKADIIYIEISSGKTIKDKDDFYYNIDKFIKYVKNNDDRNNCKVHHKYVRDSSLWDFDLINKKYNITQNIMTYDEILEDIKLITNKFNSKKFIFQGHLNLKFNHELLPKNFVIQQRQLIDNALINSKFPTIILKDIFKNWNLMEILDKNCVKNNNSIDLNHLSNNAKKEISHHFEKIINK